MQPAARLCHDRTQLGDGIRNWARGEKSRVESLALLVTQARLLTAT
jgi:hypothetical protein